MTKGAKLHAAFKESREAIIDRSEQKARCIRDPRIRGDDGALIDEEKP